MKHKLHCTCAGCSGTGIPIIKQIEMLKPKHIGTRIIGAPDSEQDKLNVLRAEQKHAHKQTQS